MAKSIEAQQLLAALDDELSASSNNSGRDLVSSAKARALRQIGKC
jgi:hypothetical protein